MPGLRTDGFAIGDMVRPPNLPQNIGNINVGAIYDAVAKGLATTEAARRLPLTQQVADAQAQQALTDAPVQSNLLASQAALASANVQQAPLHGRILATQATSGEDVLKQKLDQRTKADADMPNFLKDYAEAANSDPGDYAGYASKIANLQLNHPDVLAEHKGISDSVIKTEADARLQAQNTANRKALLAKATVAANAFPKGGLAATVNGLRQLGYPDDVIQDVINKQSAVAPVDPEADRAAKKAIAAGHDTTSLANTATRAKAVRDKAEAASRSAVIEADRTSSEMGDLVDDSIDKVSVLTASFPGRLLSNLSGTEATDLKENIKTIESAVALQTLTALRSHSKSGGGLGNVSDNDIALLKASLASLSNAQTVDQLKTNLFKVKTKLDEIRAITKDDYEHQFGTGHTPSFAQIVGRNAVSAFNTPEEADAAGAAGKIQPGARITVGGVSGTWNPP